jgi:phosphatidylinositol alpha-mannosyltransferase
MKIGLVCPYNIYKGGGVQECVRELQTELNNNGHEAYIITPKPRGEKIKTEDAKKIIFIGASADIRSPFQATVAQISATVDVKAIDKMMKEYQFDVINYHEPWVPLLSVQILARSKSANVATFHAKLPETAMSKAVERAITPYTKSILKALHVSTAVSPAAAEYYTAISKKDPVIIPNGVNLDKYQSFKSKGKAKKDTILYIGRLEKRKGVRYLITAFKQLQHHYPDYKLIIAGDGPDREKLEKMVQAKKIENVTFHGYIDEQKKLELLSTSRVYCAPAIFGESFGIVLLEAMASGTVVVAGNNPGYASVMSGRGSLSIVNPKDQKDFTRKLELMMTDVDVRASWLEWAGSYVQNFDYKNVANQYIDVYHQAMKNRENNITVENQ